MKPMASRSRTWNNITTIHHFKNLKTVRVYGIVRVSTDKQARHGESLEQQRETITNWVQAKSTMNPSQEWKLVELYVENEDKSGGKRGRSATKREGRLGLSKALGLARAHLIDVVIVTKLDRIARNVKDYIDISAELNENQVALVCLDLDIDTSTPDGQMIMRNHASVAQWQAERIAQYSIETARRHALQGRPLGGPPIGYRAVRNDGKSTLIPDPVYKKHIALIDQLYLSFQSVDKVVQELHKRGYKTSRNKTYSKPQISRILRNIRYTGRQEYDGKILDGNWPALRSPATQEKIEIIMKGNRRTNHSPQRLSTKYVYLLQGLLKCHYCQSAMFPRSGTGRLGRYYPYYVCSKAEKTEGIDCEEVYLPAETIDNAVIEFLRKLRLEPSVIGKVVSRANKATSSRIGALTADIERIGESLKEVRTKLSNLADILARDGVAKLRTLKGKLETLEQEERDLTLEEKRLEGEIRAEKAQAGAAHDQIQTLELFDDLYQLNRDHPERIKAILPRFVCYIVCHFTDKKKGIGRLDVGLFGRPFSGAPNAEIWNEALQELAERCNQSSRKYPARVATSLGPCCVGDCVLVRGRVTNGVSDGT